MPKLLMISMLLVSINFVEKPDHIVYACNSLRHPIARRFYLVLDKVIAAPAARRRKNRKKLKIVTAAKSLAFDFSNVINKKCLLNHFMCGILQFMR